MLIRRRPPMVAPGWWCWCLLKRDVIFYSSVIKRTNTQSGFFMFTCTYSYANVEEETPFKEADYGHLQGRLFKRRLTGGTAFCVSLFSLSLRCEVPYMRTSQRSYLFPPAQRELLMLRRVHCYVSRTARPLLHKNETQ